MILIWTYHENDFFILLIKTCNNLKLKNYYESFVKTLWRLHFYFCFGLTFQLPSGIGQQIVFKTHFFFFFFHLHSFSFTFTIYLSLFLSWFYLLHIFTSTVSYLIPNFKKQVLWLISVLLTFGQSSRGHPKQNSLRNSIEKQ